MHATGKPVCFAIAPIGPKDSEIRKRSDKVLKHIFKKALGEKYEVIRGDDIDEPGMITSQVLRAVQDSPLVVADLTGHNPNVLYELAVRHAIEKPVIHVIEPKQWNIPFDIQGFRTIEFDLTDPDSIESAVEQLRKQAEQAESGRWGETPIKLANIMQRSSTDSPEVLLLKEAVQGISGLHAKFAEVTSQVVEQLGRPEVDPFGVTHLTTTGPLVAPRRNASVILGSPMFQSEVTEPIIPDGSPGGALVDLLHSTVAPSESPGGALANLLRVTGTTDANASAATASQTTQDKKPAKS